MIVTVGDRSDTIRLVGDRSDTIRLTITILATRLTRCEYPRHGEAKR